MPSSPDVSLEKIKGSAKKLLDKNGGKNIVFNEEPIAFGLKALIVSFIWPEDKELENIENFLGEIENVSSEEMIGMTRTLE